MTVSKLDILLKCITLLYREKEAGESSLDVSKGLVKTIISLQKEGYNKNIIGGENQIIEEIKKLLISMLNNPDTIDRVTLLDSLRLALKDKESTYTAIEKTLNTELTPSGSKRNIVSLRTQLEIYYKEQQAFQLLTKATVAMRNGLEDTNIGDFLSQLATNIEALSSPTKTKDPGIVDELDIGDVEGVSAIMGKVKKISEDGGLFQTGFKEINKMFRGGWRPGEFIVYEALQHNYKSGLSQALSTQLPIHNDPYKFLKDPNKKPLLLFVSLEDDADILLNNVYLNLYHNEFKCKPDIINLTKEDMASYVKEKLSARGWHVKYLRVDPTNWSYRALFNLVLKLESQGYELLITMLDYIAKIPTIGCISNGFTGSELFDMFNRLRNFFSTRSSLLISPHQLSTEAKQLLRQGAVSDLNFVKEIAGKGYSDMSKRIDQVWDGEFYIHKAKQDRKTVLTIGWGKHRRPGSVEEEYKYAVLQFPKDRDLPILETINTEDENTGNKDNLDDFDF